MLFSRSFKRLLLTFARSAAFGLWWYSCTEQAFDPRSGLETLSRGGRL